MELGPRRWIRYSVPQPAPPAYGRLAEDPVPPLADGGGMACGR